jgi:hypothetical protein
VTCGRPNWKDCWLVAQDGGPEWTVASSSKSVGELQNRSVLHRLSSLRRSGVLVREGSGEPGGYGSSITVWAKLAATSLRRSGD